MKKINITASISTDIIAIIALCFTIYLASQNPVIDNYKNKIYMSVAVITITLLVLEILDIFIALSSNNIFVIPHRIVNVLGFLLSPVVIFILLLFYYNNNEKNIFTLSIPLYVNGFAAILSYKTGWIFFVDAQNQYSRGNLFLIPMIISLFYFVSLMIAINKANVYKSEKNIFLVLIFVLPVIGAIIQILFKDLLLIWGCTAISLLLYYIFLRELQFEYDAQTGIKNRSAFEKEMEQYIRHDKNIAIVVLDINNLKKYNDEYGHKIGDETIIHAAKIIQESFEGIGIAFRIGGDEFCVICNDITKQCVESALSKLENLLIKTNGKRNNNKIEIAYGYDFYKKNESESIFSIFSQADKAMYEHKAKLKELYEN